MRVAGSWPRAWLLVLASALTIVASGLLATMEVAGAAPGNALTARQLRPGADHECVSPQGGQPTVVWSALRNPVLAEAGGGVKDQAIVWSGGRWHLIFSYVTDDVSSPGGIRWDIATATSADMVHWSPVDPWPTQPGVSGVASPDIVRQPSGTYLVTYQSDPGGAPPSEDKARLYFRTSTDLRHWSSPHPLAQALAPAPSDRMIDGALVYTGHQLLLGYKYSSATQPDTFELARSTSGGPQGPWRLVGRPAVSVDGGTVENYEFVNVAGKWRLMATSDNLDQPWLFTLTGKADRAAGWLSWSAGTQLNVPAEAFNTGPGLSSIGFEHANSGYLCDAGDQPGHFVYLFYAGSSELTQFDGWGHAEIGVARSTDLVHWQVPPG